MTSKQRAYLKSLAQTLDTTFQIGKNGVTPELTSAIEEALDARELLKIGVLNNCMMKPGDIAEMISGRTNSTTVQVIGKRIVLYKPAKQNGKILLPK
ncbi:MAG: RNA-binding protein [Epulopiscium sp. Nuni2H_MBin001]|nr:MAG: RNA-binding protein [Epulopiscium sp. Nuni2H_MBin001]